eukprot:7414262-Heterocapsa_arctica.AAC.1
MLRVACAAAAAQYSLGPAPAHMIRLLIWRSLRPAHLHSAFNIGMVAARASAVWVPADVPQTLMSTVVFPGLRRCPSPRARVKM